MIDREEFEKWYRDNCSDNHLSNEGYMFEEWQHQQKIINELRNEIEELTGIIDRCSGGECYPCDAESMPKNLMKQIKELEALNPDVPCPACGGKYKIAMGRNITDTGYCYDNCSYCKNGKVPLTKAQEYRIKELEEAETALKAGKNE